MQGAGIVRYAQHRAAEQGAQRAQRCPAGQIDGAVAHGGNDRSGPARFGLAAIDQDARALAGQCVRNRSEAFGRPAPPRICGAGLYEHQRTTVVGGVQCIGCMAVGIGELQAAFHRPFCSTRERRHFQQLQAAIDQAAVRQIAVQRRRVRGPHAQCQPGAKAQHKRVGKSASAKHLQGKIEMLALHLLHETVDRCAVAVDSRCHGNAWTVGQGEHPVDRPWPPLQEVGMPLAPEIHNFCLGIAAPQRMQCRQREHKIADRVGPEHGDLAHAADSPLSH